MNQNYKVHYIICERAKHFDLEERLFVFILFVLVWSCDVETRKLRLSMLGIGGLGSHAMTIRIIPYEYYAV